MNHHFVREKRIDITRLANGLTVATEQMPEIATATLGVWIGTGSRHEAPQEHGLSHLIEHMAFKGTERRSARQIAEDIENVGGDINAATSVEYTSYSARVLGENADVALDVLGDILTASLFDPVELARQMQKLALNPKSLAKAAAMAKKVGRPDAASDLADLVERIGRDMGSDPLPAAEARVRPIPQGAYA